MLNNSLTVIVVSLHLFGSILSEMPTINNNQLSTYIFSSLNIPFVSELHQITDLQMKIHNDFKLYQS